MAKERLQLSFSTAAAPEWDLGTLIEGAHRYGYNGIEFVFDKEHAHGLAIGAGAQAAQEARGKVQEAKLAVAGASVDLPIAALDGEPQQMVEQAGKWLELAQQLGAPALSINAGPMPADVEPAGVVDFVSEVLDEIVERAEEAKVAVLLQTQHQFANTSLVREICKQLYSEYAGIVWNVAQTLRRLEALEETYDNLKSSLRLVHVQDMAWSDDRRKVTFCGFGEGDIRWSRVVDVLHEAGYEGFLSVVSKGDDPHATLAAYADGLYAVLEKVTGMQAPGAELYEEEA